MFGYIWNIRHTLTDSEVGGKYNCVEGMETGQNMFEHVYMLEHEDDEDQMDINTTEVKKVTNDIDIDFNEFDET